MEQHPNIYSRNLDNTLQQHWWLFTAMVHYSKVSQIMINIELYTGTTKGWVWDHFGIRIIWVIAKRLRWLEPSPHGLLSLCPYFGSSNITSKCLVSAVDVCIQSSPVGCLSTSNCAHTSPKETLPKPTLVAVHMNMQCYDHYGQTLSVYKPSNSAKYLGLRCGWAKTPDETLWWNLIWLQINTYRYLLGQWTPIYQLFWCPPGV